MGPIVRVLAALVLAAGSAWVPFQSALACSCGFSGYPEAIAAADVAFIGTVVGAAEPGILADDVMPLATVTFDISSW